MIGIDTPDAIPRTDPAALAVFSVYGTDMPAWPDFNDGQKFHAAYVVEDYLRRLADRETG